MTDSKFNFSNIGELKRQREIEGTIGIHVRYTDEIFLHVLAISDANPRWLAKSQPAFDEINRLTNRGESDDKINHRLCQLLQEAVVLGWHGGFDDDGNQKPGGPRDDDGRFVPYTPESCIAFLMQADDVVADLQVRCKRTQNFRVQRAKAIVETIKND